MACEVLHGPWYKAEGGQGRPVHHQQQHPLPTVQPFLLAKVKVHTNVLNEVSGHNSPLKDYAGLGTTLAKK